MLRLFAAVGALTVVSAVLAVVTFSLFFRLATLVLGGTIIALCWWLHRSLPQRSGFLLMKGLREQVEVFRDERGIPHIFAHNLPDLYTAQGYLTAQDRLWSMELARRAASGRMAELFGAQLLPQDRHARTVGLRRVAEASLKAYSPQVAALLEAYAAGVNARIDEHRLPPEFNLVQLRPEPWTAVDTLAIAKHLEYQSSSTWAGKLFRAGLVQAVGPEKAGELFPEPPNLTALAAVEGVPLPEFAGLLDLAAQTLREGIGGAACAISGTRSRSGTGLLVGDASLPIGNPVQWYEAHLVGPDGLDVTGATLPGIPGVLMGHNRDLAWNLTGSPADVQEVYLEQLNPETPAEYVYRGTREAAAFIPEEIRVRGGSAPVVQRVMLTRHGPVIARDDRTALALQWTGHEPSADLEGILALAQARNWPDIRQALGKVHWPLQVVCAAKDGTVATGITGALPVRGRPGAEQTLVPGWEGLYEWDGFVPAPDLPEAVNPADGYVVAATSDALGGRRAHRLAQRLGGTGTQSSEHLREAQADLLNLQARDLLQLLLQAVQEGLRQGHHPETLADIEKRALLMLSGWDCEELPTAPGAVLWHQWYLFLLEGIFRPQIGLDLFDQFVSCGSPVEVSDRLIRRVVEGGESQWLGREGETGLNRVALRAFRRAVALVSARQGQRPERWRWDRAHKVPFVHDLTQRYPWLSFIMNPGRYPVGGSAATAMALGFDRIHPFEVAVAATWRQTVDLGSVDDSYSMCAPGQSGHAMSPHYADQISPWLKGEVQPRLLRQNVIRARPRLVLYPDGTPPLS